MKKLLVLAGLMAFGGVASAAVPAEVTQAATDIATDIPLYVAAFIPVLAASILGGIAFKLAKRYGNKAV